MAFPGANFASNPFFKGADLGVNYSPEALKPTPGVGFTQIPLAGNAYTTGQMQEIQNNPIWAAQFKEKPFETALTYLSLKQNDPEYQAKLQQDTSDRSLAYYKQLGEQQMKYRMTNDIIANLGSAARSAFSRYTDPAAIAQLYAGAGDVYARAAQGSQGLTNLGASNPAVKYYNV